MCDYCRHDSSTIQSRPVSDREGSVGVYCSDGCIKMHLRTGSQNAQAALAAFARARFGRASAELDERRSVQGLVGNRLLLPCYALCTRHTIPTIEQFRSGFGIDFVCQCPVLRLHYDPALWADIGHTTVTSDGGVGSDAKCWYDDRAIGGAAMMIPVDVVHHRGDASESGALVTITGMGCFCTLTCARMYIMRHTGICNFDLTLFNFMAMQVYGATVELGEGIGDLRHARRIELRRIISCIGHEPPQPSLGDVPTQ